MSKQNHLHAFILSVSALATLCLLATVITAQKAPNSVSGAPLKGVDIKLGKNPGGNAAARTFTTDENGKIVLSGLEPGSYYLIVVGPSKQQQSNVKLGLRVDDLAANRGAVAADNYLVEITGLADGPISREWNAKERKFVKPSNATARATTAPSYEDKINFEIGTGSPVPVCTFIIKSKSNISSN